MLRWNLSSRARELSGGDAIVASIPKSGRTWVRTFLCAYFCRRYGYEFSLEPEQSSDERMPRIVYSHDRFEQRTKADRWDDLRGKYFIPAAERRRARIILLARDPRDTFVSHYLQLTRRTRETPDELKQQKIGEVLRDRRHGIASMIEVMNGWLQEWSGRPDFLLLRYEDLQSTPEQSFHGLLKFLGEEEPDPEALAHALEFSRFGNMKKMETAGAFASKILQPTDVADPESFKVRRGKVGGFTDYLTGDDLAYANEAVQRLDAQFRYGGSSAPPLDAE
ncbi:MAG TPA: sulfotransferase domain-containing protein [Chthoniobacterales bacterium]|nr:sulfotransferase domain-containing protein [Chthoniobacterales bacterium]